MAYKVFISVGKGKNLATSGSIRLSTKQDVANWVKRHPLGNSRTEIKVRDLGKRKTITGTKLHFRSVGGW